MRSNYIFCICLAVICGMCGTGIVETSFVTLNEYTKFGINSEECGLRYPMKRIDFQKKNIKCHADSHPNISYFDFGSKNRANNRLIQSRILNGTNVTTYEAPWVIRIIDHGKQDHETSCTGVLITFEWVLSAAHCIPKPGWEASHYSAFRYFEVQAGSNILEELRDQSKKRRIAGRYFFVHDKWKINDIGLVRLWEPLTMKADGKGYRLNTICLPTASKTMNEEKEPATFFGWGQKEKQFILSEAQYPKLLLKADIVLRTYSDCNKTEHTTLNNTHNKLCAIFEVNYKGATGCDYDSGSPLVQQIVDSKSIFRSLLIGFYHLAKGGQNMCYPGSRSVAFFEPVPRYIHWILETIRKNMTNP